MRIAPSIKKGHGGPYLFIKGVLSSLMCVLLLPPIPEGVIGIKPRGDTREKRKTLFFRLELPTSINRSCFLYLAKQGEIDMDPPVTTLTLFQIEQEIVNVENEKLLQEQTLAAFWEHMPPVEEEVLAKRIQELRGNIRALESRRRALIRERELLLIRAASIIRRRPGANN